VACVVLGHRAGSFKLRAALRKFTRYGLCCGFGETDSLLGITHKKRAAPRCEPPQGQACASRRLVFVHPAIDGSNIHIQGRGQAAWVWSLDSLPKLSEWGYSPRHHVQHVAFLREVGHCLRGENRGQDGAYQINHILTTIYIMLTNWLACCQLGVKR
jgi:hypothetical protein